MTSSMSGSAAAIAASLVGERVDRETGLHAGLRAHALDDPADARRQLAGVQAPGRPGDVAHQAGGELDLVQDAQDREQRAQVGRHRLLEREQLVHRGARSCEHPVLDLAVRRVDLVDDDRGRRRGGPGSRRRSARRSCAASFTTSARISCSCSSNDRRVSTTMPSGTRLHRASLPTRLPACRGSCHGWRGRLFTCRFTRGPPVPYGPARRPSYHGHVSGRTRRAWVRAAMLGRRRSLAEGRTCPQPNR